MQAGIPYTVATGEKLVNETFGPNNIHRKTSGTQEWHAMEVRDGRQGRFSLDENGFVFVEHKTAVRDFLSEKLEKAYYPEVAALIQSLSGASASTSSTTRCAPATRPSARPGCCASRCSRRTTITPIGRDLTGFVNCSQTKAKSC